MGRLPSNHRLSKGYAPASHEELDAAITGDALQLLLRIRRDCDKRETDGFIASRHLAALAVEHGMSESNRCAALEELIQARLVRAKQDGYQDVRFLEWCRPAEKREAKRAQWRAAQKRHRLSADDSNDDSTDESSTLEKEKREREEARQAANFHLVGSGAP